jgi:hypothetical protein
MPLEWAALAGICNGLVFGTVPWGPRHAGRAARFFSSMRPPRCAEKIRTHARSWALQALGWELHAVLEQAGLEIDAGPQDLASEARVRALKVRHLIERACAEVLDRFGRATGPQLLAHDEQVARQYAALALYIRQCHAERDLETIPAAG